MPTHARARIDNLTGYSSGFPSLEDLQKTYDSLIGTVRTIEDFVNDEELKAQRKITKVNYDNETKKMTISYNDGTSKVFNEVEVTDVVSQECSEFNRAEISYRFKDFVDDYGKYVEDFGDVNG